jgi:hypothetical protein
VTEAEIAIVEAAIQSELDRDFRAWEHAYTGTWGVREDAPEPPSKVWHTSPRRVAIAAVRALEECRGQAAGAGRMK